MSDGLGALQAQLTEALHGHGKLVKAGVSCGRCVSDIERIWPLIKAAVIEAEATKGMEALAVTLEEIDVSMDDAPAGLNSNEASAWANGHEAGLDRVARMAREAVVARGVPVEAAQETKPHRVELFWRGKPDTYGWQCLDCDAEENGWSSPSTAFCSGAVHGEVQPEADVPGRPPVPIEEQQ